MKLHPHLDPPLPSLARPALATAIPSEQSVWNVDIQRRWRIGFWTLAAALLLHLLPLFFWLWQLWHWPTDHPEEEPAIEVALVREPPKPPPPPPQAKQETPPPDFKPRISGPDDVTEAQKTEKPMPAPPKPRLPSPKPPTETATTDGLAPPKPDPGSSPLVLRLPSKGGNAARDRAGDPYINSLLARIESYREYPPADWLNGASEKTVIFRVGVDPTGDVATITIAASSGVQRIDEIARRMILNSRPLPPFPPDYPNYRAVMTIYVPVYARGTH